MLGFIWKKFLQSLCTVLVVTFFAFFLVWLMPGDAATLQVDLDSASISSETAEELRSQYHLDQSLPVQYMIWLDGMLHGNFGTSSIYHQAVTEVVAKRLGVTFRLGFVSLILSSFLGIFLGYVAARNQNKPLDNAICFFSGLGISTPPFLVAILLIIVFSVILGWLPVQGYTDPSVNLGLHVKKMILPCAVATFGGIAPVIRQTRSSVLEVLGKEFVRTANAKGLKRKVITSRYIIRNALIPVLTLFGMQVCVLFGGVVVVENVFNIPGMGSLLVSAVKNRDVPLVQFCILVMAVAIITSTFLVDIAYGIVDPRMRQLKSEV